MDKLLRRVQRYQKKPFSFLFAAACWIAIMITIFALLVVLGYIFIHGIPNLKPEIIFGKYSSDNPSMGVSIFTTFLLICFTLLLAAPVSIFSAVYLTEYTQKGNRLVWVIRLAVQTLSGIPSIVYGLFGAIFFGGVLGWGYSILTGICTVAIMILPIIISATEEAIKAVPDTYREGSYGLGASKLRTIFKIVLPAASPGILSSIILSIGRIVGETAALIFTLGSVTEMPHSLMDASRTLAIHMYINTRDGGMNGRNTAFATGVILILVVIAVNIIATWLVKKVGGKKINGK